MSLSLRPMRRGDAEALSSAFRAMGWDKPAETFVRYVEEQEQGRRSAWVAEQDGELAGYVTLVWESADPVLASGAIPEVVDLNVVEGHRRRGIGGALLARAEDEARKRSDTIGLRVGLHGGYGAAQRMYVQRGYVPDGAGALVEGTVAEEGATIRLDDNATLRMTKRLGAGRRVRSGIGAIDAEAIGGTEP